MDFDFSGITEQFNGAERPYEKIVTMYSQMYERMSAEFDDNHLLTEWDSVLVSLDMMINHLSKINDYDLSPEFRTMRDMYIEIIKESIQEIEEVIEDL